jgi:pSer/pThr/pTyr-binding forkhead associated (FHA) protein
MLKLHFKDNSQPAFWAMEKFYSIGSSTENNLVVNDPKIDAIHAKLFVEDNKYILKDNSSSSGCYINGQRITQKEILPGDTIRIGNTEIIVLDPGHHQNQDSVLQAAPWRLVSESSWLPGKTFLVMPDRPVVIGRTEQCDITIPGSHLSRRHVELHVQGSRLFIKDLGSANGTFINDQNITEFMAENGDRLRLDVYTFRIVAPESDANKTRIRATPESIAKPVERKLPSNEPKRWKTRPTSPGNRIEVFENPSSSLRWRWIFLGIALIGLAMIGSKILW